MRIAMIVTVPDDEFDTLDAVATWAEEMLQDEDGLGLDDVVVYADEASVVEDVGDGVLKLDCDLEPVDSEDEEE